MKTNIRLSAAAGVEDYRQLNVFDKSESVFLQKIL